MTERRTPKVAATQCLKKGYVCTWPECGCTLNAAPQDVASAATYKPREANAEPAVAARAGQFDKEQKPPLPIEVILGAFAVDALQENFDYLKRWAGDVKIETYNGVPVVRLGFALSATLPHDLIYKLHGWTGQLAEQPPSRIAPGIAQAAKRLHDELQLYVQQKADK